MTLPAMRAVSEGEAGGLERGSWAFPKKLVEILNFTISVINNFGSEVSRIRVRTAWVS